MLGVPVIQSHGETDPVCAQLIRNKKVDAIISEDTDMLPYGCHTFICGLKERSNTVYKYKLTDVLNTLDLKMTEFIDLCILCGCDYSSKIRNIGPTRGLCFIKECKSIERLLIKIENDEKMKNKYLCNEKFLDQVFQARKAFIEADIGQLVLKEKYVWMLDVFDEEKWKELCLEKNLKEYENLDDIFGSVLLKPLPLLQLQTNTLLNYFAITNCEENKN